MTITGPLKPEQVQPRDQLCEIFGHLVQPLYAVLDGARDRRILRLLEESGCEFRMLYGCKLAEAMDHLGPYLVALPPKSPFLATVLEKGWGNSWGIFLTGSADIQAVLRHLRRLLAARRPDGEVVLFRFYDPRVLRDYLPHCDGLGLEKFFGPVRMIMLESATGQELLLLSPETAHPAKPTVTRLAQSAIQLKKGAQLRSS